MVGDFLFYRQNRVNRVAKLNLDGSLDSNFNITEGANRVVEAVEGHTNGILIGGQFTNYNSITTINRIIKIDLSGEIDPSFNTGTGFSSTVFDIKTLPDDKVLVGGSFGTYKGTTALRICRLTDVGDLDPTFDTGSSFGNGSVMALAPLTDGRVLVGGSFTNFDGQWASRIISLNPDGSRDTGYDFTTSVGGANGIVWNILPLDEGKAFLVGDFTVYKGTTLGRIVRILSDGSIDTSFDSGTGANGLIRRIYPLLNDRYLLLGAFTEYNGVLANYAIKILSDGTPDPMQDLGYSFNGQLWDALID